MAITYFLCRASQWPGRWGTMWRPSRDPWPHDLRGSPKWNRWAGRCGACAPRIRPATDCNGSRSFPGRLRPRRWPAPIPPPFPHRRSPQPQTASTEKLHSITIFHSIQFSIHCFFFFKDFFLRVSSFYWIRIH